jgi:two-component system, LytTR family, sensor kinase
MKKKYIIGIHLLVWILLIAGDALTLIRIPQIKVQDWWVTHREVYLTIISAIYILISCLTFYGTAMGVMPLIFRKRHYLWGILAAFGLAISIVLARFIIEFWLFKPYLAWDNYSNNANFTWSWFISNCLLFNFRYVVWGIIYFFVVEWYRTTTHQKALEREKTKAELAFLKSQINPHFLFNTINDIYALAYVKDDNAPEALLKLSGMLRYMLHESNTVFVPLEKELAYVKDFIDLQNIGFKGNTHVKLITEGNTAAPMIAPMLFIPFVENAFKHGDFDNELHPIEILCRVENQQITFQCKNLVRHQQKDKLGGIGLQNVKRRLALLYPNKYQLDIDEKDGSFMCSLVLKIN